MKKMILSLLVFAFTTTASAFVGNEGPEAAPALPTTLVERSMGSGFVPPGAVAGYKLEIIEDGSVRKTVWIAGEEQAQTEVIMYLSIKKVSQIRKLVATVKAGKLEDANPNAPRCEDAPSFRDVVYKKGVKIEIARKADCKKFVRKSATDADKTLIEILNAIETLDSAE